MVLFYFQFCIQVSKFVFIYYFQIWLPICKHEISTPSFSKLAISLQFYFKLVSNVNKFFWVVNVGPNIYIYIYISINFFIKFFFCLVLIKKRRLVLHINLWSTSYYCIFPIKFWLVIFLIIKALYLYKFQVTSIVSLWPLLC